MISKVLELSVANVVKDLAINTVSIAAGADGDDVFIDLDTVGDRFPQESDYPQLWGAQAIKDLRECVEQAHKADAQYLHLY